jgi:hypothetical protein
MQRTHKIKIQYFNFIHITVDDMPGVDFNHFVKVRLEVTHGSAKFFVDDKQVYQIDASMMSSTIKGIVYRFQGTGSVDWVKLYSGDGKMVYDDEF